MLGRERSLASLETPHALLRLRILRLYHAPPMFGDLSYAAAAVSSGFLGPDPRSLAVTAISPLVVSGRQAVASD